MNELWALLLAVGAIALPLALAWWLARAPDRRARRARTSHPAPRE